MTDWYIKTAVYSAFGFTLFIAFLFLITSRREEKIPHPSYEPLGEDTPVFFNRGREIRVIEDDKDAKPDVTYTAQGFSPSEIHADADKPSPSGCMVRIKNASLNELVIRVGPFEAGNEKGVLYTAIAAGERSIIDPRYSNYPKISFYNKHMPMHSFRVMVSPTCF